MQFRNEFKFMSNFQYAEVVLNGITYPTVENAFQAAKTLDPDQRVPFRKATPNEAKRLGQHITLRPNWDTVKFDIMRQLLQSKFPADPNHKNYWLSKKLIGTGNMMLVEENYWHDNVWGACTCEKCKNKPHNNRLGLLLMERRAQLKNK